jgi:hypothetical protein
MIGSDNPEQYFIGWLITVRHADLGVDMVGSPYQVLKDLERIDRTFHELSEALPTEIQASRVFGHGTRFNMSPGPHVPLWMKLMEYLDASDYKASEKLLASDPTLIAGDHDAAPIPLLGFASLGRADTVKFLVEHGAPINRPRPLGLGMTPLHWAAAGGHRDAVSVLIDSAADAGLRNWHFHSAADLAHLNGHPGIAETLSDYKPGLPEMRTLQSVLEKMGADFEGFDASFLG